MNFSFTYNGENEEYCPIGYTGTCVRRDGRQCCCLPSERTHVAELCFEGTFIEMVFFSLKFCWLCENSRCFDTNLL